MLRSPLHRWHVLHAARIWLGVRVLVMMASTFGRPSGAPLPAPSQLLQDPIVSLATVALTMVLAAIDRRRADAPLLFANLGYSATWLALTTLAVTLVTEGLLRVLVSLMPALT